MYVLNSHLFICYLFPFYIQQIINCNIHFIQNVICKKSNWTKQSSCFVFFENRQSFCMQTSWHGEVLSRSPEMHVAVCSCLLWRGWQSCQQSRGDGNFPLEQLKPEHNWQGVITLHPSADSRREKGAQGLFANKPDREISI